MAGGNKMVWLDRTEIVTGLILAGELNVNLVNAKYDFVLRKRILDYYQGQ